MLLIAGQLAGVPKVWSWNGSTLVDLAAPTPGGATRYVSTYHDGTLLYAGTDSGHLYSWNGTTWNSFPIFTAKPIVSVLEYDDGVNGLMLFALASDPPDHSGGPGTTADLFYSNDGGANWNPIAIAGLLGATGMMVASGTPNGDILGICTHSIGFGGNGVWVNTNGTEIPQDVTTPGVFQQAGPGVALKGHGSFFWYGAIGSGLIVPKFHLTTDESAGIGKAYDTTLLYPGPWADRGQGAGLWMTHAAYGPHSGAFKLVGAESRLYVFDWGGCDVGYLQGTAAYPEDANLPGAGVAAPTTAGEPVAFAVDPAGDLFLCYSDPSGSGPGYLYKRIADGNWAQELPPSGGRNFFDMVAVPAPIPPERTPFDFRCGLEQSRVEPDEVSPLEGDHVFVLGSEFFEKADVATGDSVTLKTNWDFTTNPIGAFAIYFRIQQHETEADPTAWRLEVLIAGGSWRVIDLDDVTPVDDSGWVPIQIPTGKLSGLADVEFKLERLP